MLFNAECRLAFDQKQTAYYSWSRYKTETNWQNFVRLRSAANRCYAQAKRVYHGRCHDALLNVSNHHSWWRTFKESILGVNPLIPPLLGPGGGLVTGREERAELFSSHFDSKRSREDLTLPLVCQIRPSFCSNAFRSREVESLLLDLDSYGGCDPQGFFLSF